MIKPRRTLTTLAVGFLALDAVLFFYAAAISGRVRYVVAGAVCAVAAALVVRAWRRYRRTLEELDHARREMRVAVESMRAVVESGRRGRTGEVGEGPGGR